ncbi:MAG: tetratricopeptide repeat protein [Myxococcota bacterium]
MGLLCRGGVALLLLACGAEGELDAGEQALARGDLPAAEAAYRRALDAEPANAEALYGLGWTWHLAGREDLARDAFDQCVAAHPESALGYKGLGSVAMAEGNPVLARKQFDAALARSPGDLAIRHSLGLLDLSTRQYAEAERTFVELAKEAPDRAEFQQARAEALLGLDRAEEALLAAQKAIDLGGEPRVRALARMTRARALLAASAGRVDPNACARTAPAVYAWLDEADRVLDEAEATGSKISDVYETRRAVSRRRGIVDDTCPGLR